MTPTLARLRHRLFGSPGNTLLTLVMLVLFALVVPPVLRWAVLDAAWSAAAPSCAARAAGPAGPSSTRNTA